MKNKNLGQVKLDVHLYKGRYTGNFNVEPWRWVGLYCPVVNLSEFGIQNCKKRNASVFYLTLNPFITDIPEESREKWESFVSGTLAEMNKQNTVDLVRTKISTKTPLLSILH